MSGPPVFQPFQHLDQHEHAGAVIHRLAHHQVAHPPGHLIERDHVAHPHLRPDLVGPQAQVDEEFPQLGHLLAVIGAGDVNGPPPRRQDARQRAAARQHRHVAGEQGARIEAAQRLHPQKALVVDEAHQKADLVHVGAEHHAFAGRVCLWSMSGPEGDDVAHRVHPHLVGQTLQLRQHVVAHGVLASRHAVEVR